MPAKTIALEVPFQHFGTKVEKVTLKEPNGALYARLGEPFVMVSNASTGSFYPVEQQDVIRQYLEELVTIEVAANTPQPGAGILAYLGLEDAAMIKEELLGFFFAVRAKIAQRRSTSSSSAPKS